MSYTYKYPRPSVTVDAVVFGVSASALKILLVERADAPFKGHWALPGGFVQMNESLEAAVHRELDEETGVRPTYLEQLYTFGDVRRDPRGRVIGVAYLALVNTTDHSPMAGSDARIVKWFWVEDLPKLAFDHDHIIRVARQRLRAKARYAPIGFDLMPEQFTIGELQKLYELVLGHGFERSNFRKKILGMGFLKQVGQVAKRGVLYSFDADEYARLERRGFDFEI